MQPSSQSLEPHAIVVPGIQTPEHDDPTHAKGHVELTHWPELLHVWSWVSEAPHDVAPGAQTPEQAPETQT